MNTLSLTGQAHPIKATPSSRSQQPDPQEETHVSPYIQPVVLYLLARYPARRVLCVGRGNGKLRRALQDAGCIVAHSESGMDGHAAEVSASTSLSGHGCCDMMISTEIHEPFFKPALLIERAAQHLSADGILLLSIPYYGHLKNLFVILWKIREKYCPLWWDSTPLALWLTRDGLKSLLESSGFTLLESIGVRGASRQWETVILLARKETSIAR